MLIITFFFVRSNKVGKYQIRQRKSRYFIPGPLPSHELTTAHVSLKGCRKNALFPGAPDHTILS